MLENMRLRLFKGVEDIVKSLKDEEFTQNYFLTMIDEIDVFQTLSKHLKKDDLPTFKKEMSQWTQSQIETYEIETLKTFDPHAFKNLDMLNSYIKIANNVTYN